MGFFGGAIALDAVVPLIEDRDVDAVNDGRALGGLVTELVLGRDDTDGRDEAREVRGVAAAPAGREEDVLEDKVPRRAEAVGVLTVAVRAAADAVLVLPAIRFDRPLLVPAFPASSPDVRDRLPSWSEMELLDAPVAGFRRVDVRPPIGRVGGLFKELPRVDRDEEVVGAAFGVLVEPAVTLPAILFGATDVAGFPGETFSKFFSRLAIDEVTFGDGEGASSGVSALGGAVFVTA
jgi:hypothetical protein